MLKLLLVILVVNLAPPVVPFKFFPSHSVSVTKFHPNLIPKSPVSVIRDPYSSLSYYNIPHDIPHVNIPHDTPHVNIPYEPVKPVVHTNFDFEATKNLDPAIKQGKVNVDLEWSEPETKVKNNELSKMDMDSEWHESKTIDEAGKHGELDELNHSRRKLGIDKYEPHTSKSKSNPGKRVAKTLKKKIKKKLKKQLKKCAKKLLKGSFKELNDYVLQNSAEYSWSDYQKAVEKALLKCLKIATKKKENKEDSEESEEKGTESDELTEGTIGMFDNLHGSRVGPKVLKKVLKKSVKLAVKMIKKRDQLESKSDIGYKILYVMIGVAAVLGFMMIVIVCVWKRRVRKNKETLRLELMSSNATIS